MIVVVMDVKRMSRIGIAIRPSFKIFATFVPMVVCMMWSGCRRLQRSGLGGKINVLSIGGDRPRHSSALYPKKLLRNDECDERTHSWRKGFFFCNLVSAMMRPRIEPPSGGDLAVSTEGI